MNQFATELTDRITPNYMEKLGILTALFSDIHNSESYYETDNTREIQKKITHLLEYTNLVLFIQGTTGTGKTSIIKQRLLSPKEDWVTCYFSAKDYTTADAFIEKLAQDFKLSAITTQSTLPLSAHSLHQQLNTVRESGKLPILIIDDITQINDNVINALLPLLQTQNKNHSLIRLIIAGEDIPASLLNIIPNEDNENNAKRLKYLPVLPLSEAETGEYLKFKLASAGYTKASPFTTDRVKEIYLEAKGFPHKTNQLAHQWLSEPTDKKEDTSLRFDINKNNNKLKLAAISLAALVIIFIISINLSTDAEKLSIENNQTVTKNRILEIPDKEKTIAAIATEKAETETETESIAITPAPLIEKEVPPAAPAKDTKILETPPKIKNTIKKLATNERAKHWVEEQDSDFFTLQLISGTKKTALEQFIKKHRITNDAYIFSTTRNGKPWHSVIYKSYKQRKKAQAAANTLPSSLKQTKPWIRTFGHIKRDMQ